MHVQPARTTEEVIDRLPVDALLSTDQDVLVEWCLQQLGWPQSGDERVRLGPIHHHMKSASKILIHVPVLSDAAEFETQTNLLKQFGGVGYQSCGTDRVAEIQVNVRDQAHDDPSELKQSLEKMLRSVQDGSEQQAAAARHALSDRRQQVASRLEAVIAQRVTVESAVAQALTSAGIPLGPSPGESRIPLTPTGLDLTRAMHRASAGVPEVKLDGQIRDQILGTIRAFASALERLPSTARRLTDLNEEPLRDVLLFVINSNWRMATGEAFSGSGKTDIQLQFDGRVAFMAELKIYDGPDVISDAVNQVCGYMVWRDTHAALVIIIKSRKDVELAISRIRAAIEAHPRFIRRTDRTDQYVLTAGDATRTVTIDLITVPLSDQSTSLSP